MNALRPAIAAALAAAALSASLVSMPAHAASSRATVSIVNRSSITVVSVVSSPTYSEYDGDIDVLGPSTLLSPGQRVAVNFDTADAENQCMQDVVATSSRGTRWKKRMNVCTTTTWTLYD